MRQIALTQDYFALVDDEDHENVCLYRWRAFVRRRSDGSVRVVYAARYTAGSHSTRQLVYMHAQLACTPEGMFTDHVDGNGLNNCRSNLRVVSNRQNQYNQTHKAVGCTSRFRGVSWDKKRRVWIASISVNGYNRAIGHFADERVAAGAYDVAGIARDPEHFTPNFGASWLAP